MGKGEGGRYFGGRPKISKCGGKLSRDAVRHYSLCTIECIANVSSALRAWDEFDNSNFGGNFPGYVIA